MKRIHRCTTVLCQNIIIRLLQKRLPSTKHRSKIFRSEISSVSEILRIDWLRLILYDEFIHIKKLFSLQIQQTIKIFLWCQDRSLDIGWARGSWRRPFWSALVCVYAGPSRLHSTSSAPLVFPGQIQFSWKVLLQSEKSCLCHGKMCPRSRGCHTVDKTVQIPSNLGARLQKPLRQVDCHSGICRADPDTSPHYWWSPNN